MYFSKKIEDSQEFDAISPEPTSKTNLEKSSKFSISNPNENVKEKTIGLNTNANTYGEDIKLQGTSTEKTGVDNVGESDIGPVGKPNAMSSERKAAEQKLVEIAEIRELGVIPEYDKMQTQTEESGMATGKTITGQQYHIQKKSNGKYIAIVEGEGVGFVPNELNKVCDSFEEAYVSAWEYIFENNPDTYSEMISSGAEEYDAQHSEAEYMENETPEALAPSTEEEAVAMARENLESISDTDAPPETKDSYYAVHDTVDVDDKTLKNIGKLLKEKLSLNPQEVKAIQKIIQEYSADKFSNKNELFIKIKEQFGERFWRERNAPVSDVKRWLRSERIFVSDTIKGDIADYQQFRKSMGNKISTSKDGVPVDVVYQELLELYPDFFSEDVINPTDQFLRICEVANMEVYENNSYSLDDDTTPSIDEIKKLLFIFARESFC